jgi:hypothetical protein
LCYYLIRRIVAEHRKTLDEVGLGSIRAANRLWDFFNTHSAAEETMRISDHTNRFLEMSTTLNTRQLAIADCVINLESSGNTALIYVDGPGGCGKTFLLNTLIHYFNASEIPVITVASSGVASLMLINGMTTHSRFKIPLNIDENSECTWKASSPSTQVLRDARVVIWDKISMQIKECRPVPGTRQALPDAVPGAHFLEKSGAVPGYRLPPGGEQVSPALGPLRRWICIYLDACQPNH